MKNNLCCLTKLLNLTFCSVVFMSFLVSCENAERGGATADRAEPIPLTKSQQAVAEKGNAFALALLKESYRSCNEGDLFLSPMGVSTLSCLLANGAEGETYSEIVKAIGLEGFSTPQINDYYKTMATALPKADRSVAFSLANSIWAADGFPVKKDYTKALKEHYDADSYSVNFAGNSTLKKVNGWCSTKTSGLIPKMFDELNASTRILLINALYFKGSWQNKFDKARTKNEPFTTLSGQQKEVPMMNLTASLAAYQDDEVSFVRLPYGNGAFVMEAVLPAGDFNRFIENLDVAQLERWRMAPNSSVQLQFPKFKVEFDTKKQLPLIMNALGMKKAFTGMAEFGKISSEALYVSDMRQKSYVMVDEEGTAAAAITYAEMRESAMPNPRVLNLAFNRPFLYLIRESSTGSILFIGTKTE